MLCFLKYEMRQEYYHFIILVVLICTVVQNELYYSRIYIILIFHEYWKYRLKQLLSANDMVCVYRKFQKNSLRTLELISEFGSFPE